MSTMPFKRTKKYDEEFFFTKHCNSATLPLMEALFPEENFKY